MSVVTAISKRRPTIGKGKLAVEFDATIESTFEITADVTGYPMESGTRAADHVILNPINYTMTIMASNNPLSATVTDFIGGFISNAINLPSIAGLSSGFLSGRPDTHAGAVLRDLVGLMVSKEELDIYGGDIALSNMVIVSISRTRTTENENGLEAVIELQELPRLESITNNVGSNPVRTDSNDQARTSAGKHIHKGFTKVQEANKAINDAAGRVFIAAVGGI